jgi:competence protein ComEC
MANGNLECIIFDVEHGQSVFVNSPNGYNLLIDCGGRAAFSPIKWIREHYNSTNKNGKKTAESYNGHNFALFILSHLHLDHYDDIVSFTDNDGPARLVRDKAKINTVKQKLQEEKSDSRRESIKKLLEMDERYTQTTTNKPDWGFSCFDYKQLSCENADNTDDPINNRSFVTAISYQNKKILIPGDIEVAGWELALQQEQFQNLTKGTNFFVASHHGHKSGFTKKILDYSGKPDLFIVSATSRDESVDTSYSKQENSNGCFFDGEWRNMVSTRNDGSIKITIYDNGCTSVEKIECGDNLNDNQQKIHNRRSPNVTLQQLSQRR